MEDAFDVRIILEFSGDTHPSVQWLEKVELVCRLKNFKNLTTTVPLHLSSDVFAVYQQLSDSEKKDFKKVKGGLYSAFAADQFTAYKLFVA